MGARRSLLGIVFVFGFCLTIGCAQRRGTPARSFQPTLLNPITPAEKSLKEPDLSLEEAKPDSVPQEQFDFYEQTSNEPAVDPPAVSKKSESPKAGVAKHFSKTEQYAQLKKILSDPSTVFQKAPGPRADDRLLDLLNRDLEKAFELPVESRRLEFSKAVIQNSRVQYFINYFSKRQKDHFAKALARSGRYFMMIAKVLRESGLPQELAYLALIESNFQPNAVSPAGAVGLWQFVPETARKYGLRINSWTDERRDPVKSTRAAAAYLKELHEGFGRWYLATAAYNAGQGTIQKAMKNSGAKDFWGLSNKAQISDETRNFVPKFVAAALIATNPQKYGFGSVTYDAPLDYDEVQVSGNVQLASLAKMSGTDVQTLRDLNPELLQSFTPPGEIGFRIKLPLGRGVYVQQMQKEQRETEITELVVHEVQRGDTLFSIARRYGQEVQTLMELNGLKSTTLRVGQKLKVLFERLRGTLR